MFENEKLFPDAYEPINPYLIKSGKYAGKCPSYLMFKDPSWLRYIHAIQTSRYSGGYKNGLHQRLDWLMERGENRVPQMICSHCEDTTVTCFSVRFSSHNYEPSIGLYYTYCDNCRIKFDHPAFGNVQFFPFKWSIIKYFENIYQKGSKGVIKQIIKIYRKVFVLPERLTAESAFVFFKGQSQTPYDIQV